MMSGIRSLLTFVPLALAWASQDAVASPSFPFSHSTHDTRSIGRRGLEIETYNPPSTFEPTSLTNVGYRSGFQSNDDSRHGCVRQLHDNIPFANAVANVVFKGDKVISFGSSFANPRVKSIAPSTPTVSLESVLSTIEAQIDGKHNGHPPTLEYLVRPDGSAALAHVVQIRNDDTNAFCEAFVDAHRGELLSVTDFTSHASYRGVPLEKQGLDEGSELLVNPENLAASPAGWHLPGGNSTIGNNAIAFTGRDINPNLTYHSAPEPIFDYTYNTTLQPKEGLNTDAARTNAFYVINAVHDFAYLYGFTEATFNFQTDNFGKGGVGNDPVYISVQDPKGTNNANFGGGPDGTHGLIRMYIYTHTTPHRDSAMANDILVHEYTHGITNRMTGGGTARCLQTRESAGLGEGWCDAMAEWTEHKDGIVRDCAMGAYLKGDGTGLRSAPYSTNTVTNPYTYGSLKTSDRFNLIGEVWANMLHNLYAALVDRYGWSPDAKTNPDGSEGNVVWLHLYMDGLTLQPCNPTFVQARDALIQADVNRNEGINRCLIWDVFASKGLGSNAAEFVDNNEVPEDCQT